MSRWITLISCLALFVGLHVATAAIIKGGAGTGGRIGSPVGGGGGSGYLAGCTDGVDCLCDLSEVQTLSGLVACEDFEHPNLRQYCNEVGDDPTGCQKEWHNQFGVGSGGCIHNPNPGSGTAFVRMGKDYNDCIDIVDEQGGVDDPISGLVGYCEDGETDCVSDGNYALSQRQVPGMTHGFSGRWQWGADYEDFGLTYAVKWSQSYKAPGECTDSGPAHKMNEFGDDNHSFLGTSTSTTGHNHPYAGAFQNPGGSVGSFTEHVGNGEDPLSGNWNFSPGTGDGWNWGVNAGPGEWVCHQVHWEGWGTSSATVRVWLRGDLVVWISGIDMTNMASDTNGISDMVFGNYYNGQVCDDFPNQHPTHPYGCPGDRTGYCYHETQVALRYEDSMIVSSAAEPPPCSLIGL